jgi:hypothetical protein
VAEAEVQQVPQHRRRQVDVQRCRGRRHGSDRVALRRGCETPAQRCRVIAEWAQTVPVCGDHPDESLEGRSAGTPIEPRHTESAVGIELLHEARELDVARLLQIRHSRIEHGFDGAGPVRVGLRSGDELGLWEVRR